MMIYARNTYKPKKKRKVKGEVYEKFKTPPFQPMSKSNEPKPYHLARLEESKAIPSNNDFRGAGYAPRKESQKYTGDYVLGVATMHKSNAVPVTSAEAATDIAKMRR